MPTAYVSDGSDIDIGEKTQHWAKHSGRFNLSMQEQRRTHPPRRTPRETLKATEAVGGRPVTLGWSQSGQGGAGGTLNRWRGEEVVVLVMVAHKLVSRGR